MDLQPEDHVRRPRLINMPLRLAVHAMGTRFELVLAAHDAPEQRAAAEAALEEIRIRDIRWSRFRRDSTLAHINRVAPHQPVRVDHDTFTLLHNALEIARQSNGAFDPTVAPRMKELGFHPDAPTNPTHTNDRGHEHVELNPDRMTVRFHQPGIELDLGAIAKGDALDAAAEVLHDCGINDALLHGGTSSIIARGAPPDRSGWRIRIANAAQPRNIDLQNAAMAVSSPLGRTLTTDDGRTIGHILDPRTGQPTNDAQLAAVVAPTARAADAWATALLVLAHIPDDLPEELTAHIETADGRVLTRGPLADKLTTPDTPKDHAECRT